MIQALLGLALLGHQAEPARHALLVGVEHYARWEPVQVGLKPEKLIDLEIGLDLANMSRVLKQHYGFRQPVTLHDADATKKNIRDQFLKLIDRAKPGDSIVFYFTGHGLQVPDEPPGSPGHDGELDGLDEVFVVWPASGTKNLDVFRDDDLNDLILRASAKVSPKDGRQGSVTVIVDSCHSGSSARGTAKVKGRGWDEAKDGPRPKPAIERDESGWKASDQELPVGVVLMAAAESHTTANLLPTSGSVFTTSLTFALKELADRGRTQVSYRDLHERVAPLVNAKFSGQYPQIEGSADMFLFGDGTVKDPGKGYALVTRATGFASRSLSLSAGSGVGLTVDSLVQIYARGADLALSGPIATAKLTVVDGFSSVAELQEWKGAAISNEELVGARTRVLEYAVPARAMRVAIAPDHPDYSSVKALAFIEISGMGTGSDEEVLAHFDSGPGKFRRRSGHEVSYRGVEDLKRALAFEWRWHEVRRLGSGPEAPAFDIEVVLGDKASKTAVGQRLDKPAASKIRSKGAGPLMYEGEFGYLVVRNRSAAPIHVNTIQLTAEGSLKYLAGITVPTDGDPYVALQLDGTKILSPSGEDEDFFKVFATPFPVDLSLVGRGVSRSPSHALQRLLYNLEDGVLPRTARGDFGREGKWGVAQVTLFSRRMS